MPHSFFARSALVLSTFVLAVSGCRCDGQNIGRTNGEIVVIWRNAAGERVTNRDATYDFGLALVGERKSQTMTLRNTGANRLTLRTLELSEGDEVSFGPPPGQVTSDTSTFQSQFAAIELQPNEQTELEVSFTPRGLKGNYLSKLLLTTEGTRLEDSTAVITLIGQGEKGACDLPTIIDFGKTPIGETLPFSVPFQNPTSLPAFGTAGAIVGPDAANFGYAVNTPVGQVPVAPRSSTDVVLTFTPTELRQYEATVTLTGAGECPVTTVILRGEGSNETLTWSPTSLNYGFVNPGSETIKEVIFVNPASVPIVLTAVTSTNSADFYHAVPAGTDATRLSIPGNSVPFPMRIACNPSLLGGRTGTLTFQTGLTQTPGGTIMLACTGGGPRIRVAPRPTLSFGRVGFFPGNSTFSVTRKVNVQNVGSRPPMPDPLSNLYLGEVASDGTPGQLPLFDLTPGAGTAADEFEVSLGSPYNPAVGLQAIAGSNFVDFTVKLRPQSIGMKTATFVLHSNDGSEPNITVNLTADVQQLPPCTFITSPAMANYGLVTPGTRKDLPITITNTSVTAGETCYLSGIELGAGSDLAFSIVGGNIVEKELQPQESFQVVVRAAPSGPTPTMLQTLTGQLVFNSTSSARPQAAIPLRASVGPACLTVTPDPMDFGTVRVSCSSASRNFNIYNTCSAPVTINGFTMQAAGGQPPGGPNCQGNMPCPEFRLTSSPMIPGGGLVINPGGTAPVTFQAAYRPIDVGSDSGAVAIDAIQNGQSITYLVGLQGRGDTTGIQVDTYTQDLQPKADILLVVDDSCSMADKQAALAANFNSFIQYAVAANVDYQVGVTTTTEAQMECVPGLGCFANMSKGWGGKLVVDGPTGLKFVKPTTPAVSQVFSRLVNVGTNGGGTEVALTTAVMALTPPVISAENAGFVRPDANLAVVIISDASDQSTQPVTYYQDLLVNVKGFQRLSYFTFSAITPRQSATPANCQYDDQLSPGQTTSHNSTRYNPIVQFTGGVADEICNTNWSSTLQNLGRTAFGYRTQFYLNNAPDQAMQQVVVRVNGQAVMGCAQEAGCTTWWYDSASNSIKFASTATPQPGIPLEIQYVQSCF
ncbi:MAG: choice-of-anchor D domain-containing protein [Archangium sp.]|nr:choice-of-anchor D domain-containing protein [Archangium sp.]